MLDSKHMYFRLTLALELDRGDNRVGARRGKRTVEPYFMNQLYHGMAWWTLNIV